MKTIKLTAKRQATFPVEVCESLKLEPGDEIELVPEIDAEGERSWRMKKMDAKPNRDWVGCLRSHASTVTDHSMKTVRESIVSKRTGKLESK